MSEANKENNIPRKQFQPVPLRQCDAIMGEEGFYTGSINTISEFRNFKDQVLTELSVIKGQNEELKKQNEQLVKIQAEQLVLMRQQIHCNKSIGVSRFPIKNQQCLHDLEQEIEENEDVIVRAVQNIITPGDFTKNLHRLFSIEVILTYNYYGKQEKLAFKDLKNVNSVLFKCLSRDGYTEKEYAKDIQRAFKTAKNRFHKNECIKKKAGKI